MYLSTGLASGLGLDRRYSIEFDSYFQLATNELRRFWTATVIII